jgi:hypothetical protein
MQNEAWRGMTVTMKHYYVKKCTSALPCWESAVVLSDFSFPWEDKVAPATRFQALWDDERLYFRFECHDENLVLGTGATLKERVLASDRVEIFLTPDLSLTAYFCFEMSPAGEALMYKAAFYRQVDWEWSCESLKLAAVRPETGYTVEGSLALQDLREWGVLKPDATEFFAGVYRGEFSHLADGTVKPGWMPWVSPGTERPDFHVPGSFGIFELVA